MRAAILAAALFTPLAHAEFMNGNDLLELMQSGSHGKQMAAIGYVQGVFDATVGTIHCAPRGVTVGQAHDMVQQHLQTNPSGRHFSADVIAGYLFKAAWPCKKGSGT